MKLKFGFFVIFLNFALPVFASDVNMEARKEFNACMKETEMQRRQCSFGGCGNVAAACYQRKLNVVSSSTEAMAKKLSVGRCGQAANSVSSEINAVGERLEQLVPFDGTWSGYDVQVEVALLKNKVMNALAKECAVER
ncbi:MULTISPECIES: hypothetical protein [unclassified Variovorax]|uniref:hypothetical protein n=1 Tax=unclassified Variovorax TaxID=663243 RepID=UPI003F4884E9